ncbi:hypothetical protein CGLO_00350 [Colletotrichum gloeosporioides Cg-14]|uniref:Uncharacterized protein n=1 Tax=Colletotrichum gloeosporioides (strain Cg-14) TaxID=1237896 RepID=T0L442_COLGC|nr:hypothetical protein CGLO_00350 [Colletotrichum gloeosporioides Cg-14]
MCAPCACLI